MTFDKQSTPSNAMIWTGWVLSVLPCLLLFMSGGMKLVKPEMLEQMGFPGRLGLTLGIVEIGCTVLYLIPRTTVLGASCSRAIWAGQSPLTPVSSKCSSSCRWSWACSSGEGFSCAIRGCERSFPFGSSSAHLRPGRF